MSCGVACAKHRMESVRPGAPGGSPVDLRQPFDGVAVGSGAAGQLDDARLETGDRRARAVRVPRPPLAVVLCAVGAELAVANGGPDNRLGGRIRSSRRDDGPSRTGQALGDYSGDL